MLPRPAVRRLLAALVAACAFAAPAAEAHAAITSVFTGTSSAIPCAVQANLVRLCDETTFLPSRSRSTVRSFDGVPIDVRVALPQLPPTGPDGPYPAVLLFHRYAGEKPSLAEMQRWLGRGYVTLSMTARGFGESCGTQASRDADASGCTNAYSRFMDMRYEVRDAQELAGRLADEGVIDPQRIGATGRSYGGAESTALAVLKDRTMLPDGSLRPWKSPGGKPMKIAAAAPQTAWTDLAAALFPNGSTLDYVSDAPYRGRTGVLKQSFENGLYGSGLPFYYAPVGSDPSADFTTWHNLLNAGEPYDDDAGNPLPAIAAMRDELAAHHSPYYADHSVAPAPMLISNGWVDDLFPADEAIRLYNRTRTEHPGAPISLFLFDTGHARGQNKAADLTLLGNRQLAWMDYYVKGTGGVPFQGIEALTETCPASAPSEGPYYAASWAAIAPGEVRIEDTTAPRIQPWAGSAAVTTAFASLPGDACATAPATDQPGAASYRGPVPAGGYTLMGSPTVYAGFISRGASSQVAARLLDVDPAAGTETLVARGLWRPAITSSAVKQVFQLHPNGYRFAGGHIAKLELLPNDSEYGRVSNGQLEVRVSNLQLRLPVLEEPGSLGGLVQSPTPKVLPAGYSLARDFAPAIYARPRGASPTQVSLVPAYRACTSPVTTHGGPLASGSCRPPQPSSGSLTVGTSDANGQGPGFVGSVELEVVPDDLLTPVGEADVRLTASLTDVRRASDLGDYTGELEAVTSLRVTDRASGAAGDEAATVEDTPLHATISCTPTPDSEEGSRCAIATTVDALIPGAVEEGRRSVWELGEVTVRDGGPDGVVSTPGSSAVFARQGLFAP
jgi:predicted acyl esterase